MKKHYASAAVIPAAVMKRHIGRGILVILVSIFVGCATAPPRPVTIKHPAAPAQVSPAVSRPENRQEAVEGNAAALMELLKSKNIISPDEADQFIKQYGTKAVPRNSAAAAVDSVAAVVELLKNKNLLSAAEAARLVPQYAAPEKTAVPVPEIKDREKSGNIPAGVAVELGKNIPAPGVVNGSQKEIPGKVTKSDKVQVEQSLVVITEELKKDIQEQVRMQVLEELARQKAKDADDQNDESPETIDEELKNDIEEQVKTQVLEELARQKAKDGKEQNDKSPATINEELKKDIQEQVKTQVSQEVPREIKKMDLAAAVSDWTRRVRFGGDVRLRYEGDRFDEKNADLAKPDSPTQLMNTKVDADRFKYRVRIGAEVSVNDQVDAVVRLATGNDANPVSTNSTMGDYMNRDRVYFDLAYLKWQPWKFFTFEGGRIPNPWFSTDLVWSPNLNFEGFALNVNKPVTETLTPFLTVGAFPLQQNDFSQRGKWLTAGQLGLEMKRPKGVSAKIGTAYYNFSNITGEANDPANPGLTDWTAPLFQQKGNTLFDIGTGGVIKTALASEFKILNITGNLDIGLWDPVHIVFSGDYVKNLGFDRADVALRTGNPDPEEWTTGYQIGMSVGYPKIQEFGQWKTYLNYKYLGADAVVDAFTDSDFHLGGTNAKGWIFGADLGLSKNFWLGVRWFTANEISGPPLAIDVLQVDLNARF